MLLEAENRNLPSDGTVYFFDYGFTRSNKQIFSIKAASEKFIFALFFASKLRQACGTQTATAPRSRRSTKWIYADEKIPRVLDSPGEMKWNFREATPG